MMNILRLIALIFSIAYPCKAKDEISFTIFTILENFNSSISNVVIKNWLGNSPRAIVVFTAFDICPKIESSYRGIQCLKHNCVLPGLQKPQISCIFQRAENVMNTSLLLYVNENIIFSPIAKAIDVITGYVGTKQRIMAVGKSERLLPTSQYPTSLSEIPNFPTSDNNDILDYFLYSRGSLPLENMPRFVSVNDLKWRHWLLSEVLLLPNSSMVFDITKTLKAIQITQLPADNDMIFKYNAQVWGLLRNGWKFYELGRLDYIDFAVDGEKVIQKEETPQKYIIKSMYPAMHETGFIFILTVTVDQLPLLENWLLWAQQIHFDKFLVFAMDLESHQAAVQRNLTTYSMKSLKMIGGMTYGEKYLVRNLFFQQLISVGLSFVSLSLDTVFLSNPFLDIFNGEVIAHKNRVTYGISSSFFGISTKTGYGEMFFRKVAKCWDSILGKLRKSSGAGGRNGTALFRAESEAKTSKKYQLCFDRVYFEAKKDVSTAAAIVLIDPRTLSDSNELFTLTTPQSNGFQPAVLLLDQPSEWSKKVDTLKEHHLWLHGGDNRSSLWNPAVVSSVSSVLPAATRPTRIELTIRVITMDRPESLSRMLESIAAAHYDGATVHLEFHIDHPSAKKVDISKYKEVLEIANAFTWSHGNLSRHIEEKNAGIFKMWVKPFPTRNHPTTLEVLMVLEDDMVVAPYFFRWSREILTYYSNDSRNLYGFTLQRQHSVLGIKKGGKYQLSYVDKDVAPASPFYRYQLLSTWGQFFYPGHWNAFVEWALVARQAKDFNPCIPYLFANKWYLDRPQHIWSIWFNYYVYQTGLTNLYINYNHYHPDLDYGLLINYRENGLHFSKDNKASTFSDVLLINESMSIKMYPLDRYPLYNFFFTRIRNEKALKHQWRLTSTFGNRSCITNLKKL